MRRLKLAIVFVAVAFGSVTSALANDPNDISTVVESLPTARTLSTPNSATYVQYRITLTPYDQVNNETFEPVYFSATTTVLTSNTDATTVEPGQTATFAAPLPAGCVAAGSTTINCTFIPGLSSPFGTPYPVTPKSDPKVFTVVVKAPTAGARIKLTSETRWFEKVSTHGCVLAPATPFPFGLIADPCYESGGVQTTFTRLDPVNPTVVETFLPTAGTVTTGTTLGAATCEQPWVTIVKVPAAAQVGVNLNKQPVVDNDVPGNLFSKIDIPNLANPQEPQLYGVGTPWYANDALTQLVVTTLRRDKCTIGSGYGTGKDALLILKERIYYKPDFRTANNPGPAYPPDAPPVYKPLYLCLVSGGPYVGEPCIYYAQVYTRFNPPRNVPNPLALEYLGDFEWVILANENGKFFPN